MKGTRPLDNDEIRRVSTCFAGTFEARNLGLFMLGVSTGGRISELLSLTIGDVYQNGKAVAQVKGGTYTLSHVRDFRTAMQNTDADLGVFVVTTLPTRGMQTEATRAGKYRHPFSDEDFPVLQIYEIQNHFRGVPQDSPSAKEPCCKKQN